MWQPGVGWEVRGGKIQEGGKGQHTLFKGGDRPSIRNLFGVGGGGGGVCYKGGRKEKKHRTGKAMRRGGNARARRAEKYLAKQGGPPIVISKKKRGGDHSCFWEKKELKSGLDTKSGERRGG